jgi:hypothetical protein
VGVLRMRAALLRMRRNQSSRRLLPGRSEEISMLHDHWCPECKASYLCPIVTHCTKPETALCPDHAYVDPRRKYAPVCIHCGKPAKQKDGVPVCDPYCGPVDKDLRGEETEEPSAYEPSDPKNPRWWK